MYHLLACIQNLAAIQNNEMRSVASPLDSRGQRDLHIHPILDAFECQVLASQGSVRH